MGVIENDLKDFILKRYKSVRAFTEETGIPYSTVDSILKRGIPNAGISTVMQMCDALGIDMDALAKGIIQNKRSHIGETAEPSEIDNQLRNVLFAASGAKGELSDGAKQSILNFINYVKSQEEQE